jgi:hypothetical protein
MLAFWQRNVSKLAQQLGTILIVKQILANVKEFIMNRFFYGKYKKGKVRKYFKQTIAQIESTKENGSIDYFRL